MSDELRYGIIKYNRKEKILLLFIEIELLCMTREWVS